MATQQPLNAPSGASTSTSGVDPGAGSEGMLRELGDVVARHLVDLGIAAERAAAIGDAAAEAVRERYEGELLYIPKGRSMKTLRRWQEIWDKFTGNNHAVLARDFGMSVINIYKVIRIMRERNSRQIKLDLDEPQAGPSAATNTKE